MINYVWFFMILSGVITAASKGQIHLVTEGVLKGSEQAVAVSLGLIGIIAFWSGVMQIAQDAGLMEAVAKALGPLVRMIPSYQAWNCLQVCGGKRAGSKFSCSLSQ